MKTVLLKVMLLLCGAMASLSADAQDYKYLLNPDAVRQTNEGWGVSLCWWANMCGKWSDESIDKIVDWLVSPDGLNYNIFRYNIGGGDAPGHTHMRSGKGIRAEMPGFKDSSDGPYIWTRDEAQRKIMLKIKEKRPDAIFEAFSNSPPYYMTKSGCSSGNSSGWIVKTSAENLDPSKYEEFAHYLVDVCKHYKDEYGIEFRTLEPFNEPNTNYWKDNGDQEGCKFEISSQVAFIKVLYPILQASGLNTVIAASDETDVSKSISGFNQYKSSGILDMIGQWNTHSYENATATNLAKLNSLVRSNGMRVWQSETGPISGFSDGFKGRLEMAKRLFDDVRYLECDAWHDWQYIEDYDNNWCTVYAGWWETQENPERVKNYYVRQQITKFIKPGYRFLATTNENTLAAVNEARDSLILVVVNPGDTQKTHEFSFVGCTPVVSKLGNLMVSPAVYVTNSTNDCQPNRNLLKESDGVFTLPLQGQTIATLVIKLQPRNEDEIQPEYVIGGAHYMIQPQHNSAVTLAEYNNGLRVEDIVFDSDATTPVKNSQAWKPVGNYSTQIYKLQNADGRWLRAAGNAVSVTDNESDASEFVFTPINRGNTGSRAGSRAAQANNYGSYSYKITLANGNSSLQMQSTTATTVNMNTSATTDVSAVQSNWQMILVKMPETMTDINEVYVSAGDASSVEITPGHNILSVNTPDEGAANLSVYTVSGICKANVDFEQTVELPLATGIYVVRVATQTGVTTKTVHIY